MTIGSCDDGDIRLLTSTEFDDYTVDSTEDLMGGRVEVCHNGRYGAVCDNTWENIDASVSCAQLGFSPFGNLVSILGIYSPHCPIRCHWPQRWTFQSQ